MDRRRAIAIVDAMEADTMAAGRSIDRASVYLQEARGRTETPDLSRPWWDPKLTDPGHSQTPPGR